MAGQQATGTDIEKHDDQRGQYASSKGNAGAGVAVVDMGTSKDSSVQDVANAGSGASGSTAWAQGTTASEDIGMDTDSGTQSDTGTEDTIEAVGAGEVLSTAGAGSGTRRRG